LEEAMKGLGVAADAVTALVADAQEQRRPIMETIM